MAALEKIAQPAALSEAYGVALEVWPDNEIALFGMAHASHRMGQYDAAGAAYRRLLAARPKHSAALNNLAGVLADRGCYGEALETIDNALTAETEEAVLRPILLQTRSEILEAWERDDANVQGCRSSVSSDLSKPTHR